MTVTEATTRTLASPGATITYDVRPGGDGSQPPLMLIGSPMGPPACHAVQPLSEPDRGDLRPARSGARRQGRSEQRVDPEQHAEDLHRIIQEIGGPVDLFASSGGAVNALALVAAHPEDVRTLIAHEPPLCTVLPDEDNAKAAVRAISDTYQQRGFGAGMAHFIAITGHRGEFPEDIGQQPVPDPAQFGMPTEDDGSRTDVMLYQTIIGTTHYQPDFDALREASTQIVMAAGEESAGEMANRGAYGVAKELGTDVIVFPSHHGGFLGGEYGWGGEPDAFAAKLREVLA